MQPATAGCAAGRGGGGENGVRLTGWAPRRVRIAPALVAVVMVVTVSCSACSTTSTVPSAHAVARSTRPPRTCAGQSAGRTLARCAGTAYFATAGAGVSAMDLADGRVSWHRGLPLPYELALAISVSGCRSTGYILAARGINGPSALIPFSVVSGDMGVPIPFAGSPGAVAISWPEEMAYVANSGNLVGLVAAPPEDSVTPVDLRLRRALRPVAVGGDPGGITLAPGTSTLLVSLLGPESLVPISTRSRTVGVPIRIPTPSDQVGQTVPGPVTVDGTDGVALVGNLQEDLGQPAAVLNVVDLKSRRTEAAIPLGGRYRGSGELISVPGERSVVDVGAGLVTIVSLSTRSATATVPGFGVAAGPGGRTLYVEQHGPGSAARLVSISAASGMVERTIAPLPATSGALAVGPWRT